MPLIYPFYKKVRDRNSGKEIWLIEDNAGPHKKASKMTQAYKDENGILSVKWPSNSPYLHSIEDLWGPMKSRLQSTWKEVRGASKEAKQKAYKAIEELWTSNYLFMTTDEAVLNWRSKLQRCYELNGQPNFKD